MLGIDIEILDAEEREFLIAIGVTIRCAGWKNFHNLVARLSYNNRPI